jgi:single-stranded DNA-binding protein
MIFRPRLADTVLASVKKGAHVLIEGSLVSSTYEKADGKGKKTNGVKRTSWSIGQTPYASSTGENPSRPRQ